ncbi:hypothetical protein ACTXT7_013340 [Hymenolepis weldensis]
MSATSFPVFHSAPMLVRALLASASVVAGEELNSKEVKRSPHVKHEFIPSPIVFKIIQPKLIFEVQGV